MSKPPAFQFYVKDWLSDINVRCMTPEERGGYIELLAIEWNENGLPNDDQILATLSGLGERWFNGPGEKIKKCFRLRGKKLVNSRLEKERKLQRQRRLECSLAGRKSASMRKDKKKKVTPVQRPFNQNSTNVQRKGNSSSASSSSTSKKNNTPPIVPPGGDEFETFWKAYPKKKSKGQAEKAWKVLKPSKQLQDRILDAIEQAKTSEDWTKDGGKWIPHPATWLNAKGWEDEYAQVSSNGTKSVPVCTANNPMPKHVEGWKHPDYEEREIDNVKRWRCNHCGYGGIR